MQGLRCFFHLLLYILTGNCNCNDTLAGFGVSILLVNIITTLFIIFGGLAIYKVVMIVWRKRAQAANSSEDCRKRAQAANSTEDCRKRAQAANSSEDSHGRSAHLTERHGGLRDKERAIKIALEQNQAYGSSA